MKMYYDFKGILFDKKGSGISINPQNKGKFTEAAKRQGMTPLEYARKVVHDDSASTTLKRRAQFVLNARKFKH